MIDADIRALLRQQPVFAGLDDDALTELAGLAEMVSFPMGKVICAEGETGDAAYLIYSGKVRVVKSVADGTQITLSLLSKGDLVGERAILVGEPRMASVRATGDVVAARFSRDAFLAFYNSHPEITRYFDGLAQYRSIVNFLRLNTLISALPPKLIRSVVESLEECSFAEGDVLFREGEPGDKLFIVQSGEVKAVKEIGGKEQTLAFLGEGEFVGERALLVEPTRSATVIAVHETKCLALGREQFEHIVAQAPKLRDKLLARIEDYGADPSSPRAKAPAVEAAPVARKSLDYSSAEQAHAAQTEEETVRPKRRRGFRKYPWLRQFDETDCGAASLAMVSRYYGARLSISRLRDLANVSREGASMFGLAAAAEAIGFTTRAVRTDYQHLLSMELPAIAHWAGYHYIVIYEVSPTRVTVGDPAIGLIKIPRREFEKNWTGRLLILTPTPALHQQEEQKTTLKRFLPLLAPYKVLLLEVFLASLAINLFGLATPIFTQTIIDKVLVHQDVNMLNIMLGGMIIIGVFSTATVLLRRYLLVHISQKLSLRLASDLFRQIMTLRMGYFSKRKIGDILTRFGDNAKVQSLITGTAISTILDALMVIVYLGIMFSYNAKLTGVALIFIPLSVLLTAAFTPIMKRNNQQIFEKVAQAESKLVESIDKVQAIKASAAELPTRWKYEDLIVQQANQQLRGAKLGIMMSGSSSAIHIMSSTFIL